MSAYMSVNSSSAGGSRKKGNFHIYVGGLGCHINSQEVEDYFGTFSPIDSIEMIKNKEGHYRGCCNIRFKTEPDNELMQKLKKGPHRLAGRDLQVKNFESDPQKVLKERQEENMRSIMVFDLHPEVRTEHLKRDLEQQFGPVEKA